MIIPRISKIEKGDIIYRWEEDFLIPADMLPKMPENIFIDTYYCALSKEGLLLKKGYETDGATKLPDLTQTTTLIVPSGAHDAFCYLTNQGIIPWRPWRAYGDKVFQSLCRQYDVPGWRKWYLVFIVKLNSFIKGLNR